ncbi:MAG: DUF6493 family protein [Polyangiaceae bacterium]
MSELEAILLEGDVERVKAFFSGMPEKQRRSHAEEARAFHKRVNAERFIEVEAGTFVTNELISGAATALLCTGSFAELSKVPAWQLPGGNNEFAILAERKPDWLEQWVQHLLGRESYWFSWRVVRRLVRAGLVRKPEHRNYVLGMISGLAGWDGGERSTVKQRLEDDPELLQDEVWQLFEFEGGGENSLANVDRFGQDDWSLSLLAYAETGVLSRERLMACSIQALQRDFNHYRAKWFSQFYELLEPTPDEERANADAFLGLLGVSAPNIVSWAFKRVQVQAKAGCYAPRELALRLRPLLEGRAKGQVKSALKLLEKLAKTEPEVKTLAAESALDALVHEAADVQAAALDLIEVCGEPYPAGLSDRTEMVAASLRSRVATLVGSPVAPPLAAARDVAELDTGSLSADLKRLYNLEALLSGPPSGAWVLPAATFDGTELPRLDHTEALVPIVDLEELIAVAARVLEDAASADDFERFLDGLSRLCDQQPDDFERRTGPLMKRITQLIKSGRMPFAGDGPAGDTCGLIYVWVSGTPAEIRFEKQDELYRFDRYILTLGDREVVSHADGRRGLLGLLSSWTRRLSDRAAARQARPLLSAPSHTGGLLDPRILAERVATFRGSSPPDLEVGMALLRLAHEHRDVALHLLGKAANEPEWKLAIRHALGAKVDVAKVAKSLPLWAAAARARSPWQADPAVAKAFPKAAPDVGEPAAYAVSYVAQKQNYVTLKFPKELTPQGKLDDCIPLLLHTERAERIFDRESLGSASEAGIRWVATLWPTARESLFAASLTHLAHNIDWWEARWASKTFLEPLLDPATPLREMGLLLLVTALGAKEPGEYGLATDVALAAIQDGRLGSDNLGAALRELLASGLIKPARWSKTLSDVANGSAAHAVVVKLALEQTLVMSAEPPRDFAKLLELLQELCVRLNHGVVGEPRAQLEAVKGSNKVAKLAKAILALPTEFGPEMLAAHANLAEMRVAAAQRFT